MIINIDLVYPVGSIYFSMNSTNPSKYFGGTWTQISQGRCLVGVDTNQDEFNTVNKTGGSKYLQSHNHQLWNAAGSQVRLNYGTGGGSYKIGLTYNWAQIADTGNEINTTNVINLTTGNSGNLQPYLTCYIWQRTA